MYSPESCSVLKFGSLKELNFCKMKDPQRKDAL
jgi:hypothetical protein